MTTGIMQPYFLPYIGYFQLIHSVDTFVVYDNIKYTKKGWINRNRILSQGRENLITLPLKKDPDHFEVCERQLSSDFQKQKLTNQIEQAYKKSSQFSEFFPTVLEIVNYPSMNLFEYIFFSICSVCRYLDINTKIVVSSKLSVDHSFKGQDRVLSICKALNSDIYVNPVGGKDLYSKEAFRSCGVELKFLKSRDFEYTQQSHEFVPWLSILDVLMNVSQQEVRDKILKQFDLI